MKAAGGRDAFREWGEEKEKWFKSQKKKKNHDSKDVKETLKL